MSAEDVRGRSFSLEVLEHRLEDRASAVNAEPMKIELESKLILYGHLYAVSVRDTNPSLAFNDSLLFRSFSPLRFETFMSRDTMYYSSQSGPNVVDRGHYQAYDTMLACLFTGPAVEIRFLSNPPRYEITPLKEKCKSGEYTRLDLPFALGTFFTSAPVPILEEGFRWTENKDLPSYEGLGFRPAMPIAGRVVHISNGAATAVLSSDTTVKEIRITLPNGESAMILNNDIHLGGTLLLEVESGFPLEGEVRVEQSIRVVRPQLTTLVLEKECAYILRFKVH
ncbi:MAG: hypothetical protein GTO51_10630 [Candidatus Latescibacteria bacterium]|nr:hypothetical protein [Candidatus Latescibacterota bacterium]NIM66421.1 hypothetical protein [Candidatus Latescibacterota bacterium]NIO02900.1 hypothetical protein [Candidatus Latescibacterota bacterium]NIO30035.1 hypothetical protein [Candidatus Latescibacterota bacterium]NIO57650.1 hypothetical protein [Candidatus Latescibacterota bacterium]